MDEVPSVELLEVQLVNAIATFLINARLKALMLRTHTNMAKAALNMMTRTAAVEHHGDGIHINSVDTGWVTDEDSADIAARQTAEHRFHPPLGIIDGAARSFDPIINGINTGERVWRQFLKDCRTTSW